MKIERTKNAARNIMFGIVLKVFHIFIPFLMRTAIIHFLGAQYLGLNGLFSSILQVLNLAELGVGNAMVYSMYKPIAEDDRNTICALMGLYRKYYRIIGGLILCMGLMLIPILPKLIKMDTVPDGVSIYILYLLNLSATVFTYWLFAYRNCLLIAFQRVDVNSKVALFISSITYIAQFLILFYLHDFYLYTVTAVVSGIFSNILTAYIVTKLFPGYHPKGYLPRSEINKVNSRVKDLFTSKIGSVIYDSVDTIVISAFLGMTVLAIYQNYFFIVTAIAGFITVIFTSCTAGIGNSLIVESKEKNFIDLKKFSFLICWISGFCASCMLCLYQPFMELWAGTELMLDFKAVVCFVVYFYIRQLNSLLNLYKDASGIWHDDRFRPLCAAMTNLILNLTFVNFWGIYGILLSTVIAILFVGIPWLLHNIFSLIFDYNQLKPYLKLLLKCVSGSFVICMITCYLCSFIQSSLIVTIFFRLIICCCFTNLLFYFVFRKDAEFIQSIELINAMTKGKLGFITYQIIGKS